VRRRWLALPLSLVGCIGLQDFGDRDVDAGNGAGDSGDGGGLADATLDGQASDGGGQGDGAAATDVAAGDGAAAGDAGPPGTVLVPLSGDVTMIWEDSNATVALTHLTHDVYVDANEVTVGQFRAWLTASSPNPCAGKTCTLDPGGPYESTIRWNPDDDASVGATAYRDAGICFTSSNLSKDKGDAPTYLAGNDSLPINCVTYGQAVATCAFRGMRLLTEVEWYWMASGWGQKRKYPWGDTAATACTDALLSVSGNNENDCAFPQPVGTPAHDVSRAPGVYDLMGSVKEWVWGAYRISSFPTTLPTDYAGPSRTSSVTVRGGAFATRPSDVENRFVTPMDPTTTSTDIGFRCAKTKL
jgi:formylglycine-generating enzyme required for sulfatase activity